MDFALTSVKNAEMKSDLEAHSTKKGSTWHFGYKANIGIDNDTGLIYTLNATATHVNDITVMSQLLRGEEYVIYGDSGYLAQKSMKNLYFGIKLAKKPDTKSTASLLGKNNFARFKVQIKRYEHEKSSIREKVEYIFVLVKVRSQCQKTRYRGLLKHTAKLNMVFAFGNLILVGRHTLPL